MICERCAQITTSYRLSFMNTDKICMKCVNKERKHPLYKAAERIEHVFLQRGFKSTEVEREKYHNYPGLFFGMTWSEIQKINTLAEIRRIKQNKIFV